MVLSCQIAATRDVRELSMLRKVGVVCDGLFSRQESQIVSRGILDRPGCPVVTILKDDSEAVGCIHEDLDDARFEIRKA